MPAQLIGNGGLGHAIDARYRLSGYEGFKGLQVVQVFYGTPTSSDPAGLFEFKIGEITYRCYVDGGIKSRNALQGHDRERVPGKPYYWADEVLAKPQNYDFDSKAGIGTIEIFDVPMGMRIHDAGYFETAIVAIPKFGADRVATVLRWGWCMKGMLFRAHPGTNSTEYKPLESADVSDAFRAIVGDNYPNYQLL